MQRIGQREDDCINCILRQSRILLEVEHGTWMRRSGLQGVRTSRHAVNDTCRPRWFFYSAHNTHRNDVMVLHCPSGCFAEHQRRHWTGVPAEYANTQPSQDGLFSPPAETKLTWIRDECNKPNPYANTGITRDGNESTHVSPPWATGYSRPADSVCRTQPG